MIHSILIIDLSYLFTKTTNFLAMLNTYSLDVTPTYQNKSYCLLLLLDQSTERVLINELWSHMKCCYDQILKHGTRSNTGRDLFFIFYYYFYSKTLIHAVI